MPVTAKLRYLRIAPRKVRLVADLIREKRVEEAQKILSFTIKKSSEPILKLLNSAIANAKHNFRLQESNLYIAKITVDGGPMHKRWMPRARGQAYEIQKKTSHITLILDEIEKKLPPKSKISAPPVKRKIKKEGKVEGVEKLEKIPKIEKPSKEGLAGKQVPSGAGKLSGGQAKIRAKEEIAKPKMERGGEGGIRRIFRRKAF